MKIQPQHLQGRWQRRFSPITANVPSESLENSPLTLTIAFTSKWYFKLFPKNHEPLLPLFLIIKVCSWIFLFSGTASFVPCVRRWHCSVNILPSAEAVGGCLPRRAPQTLLQKERGPGCRMNSAVGCFFSFCSQPNYLLSQIPITCNQCYREVQWQMGTQLISHRFLIVSPSLPLFFLCVYIWQSNSLGFPNLPCNFTKPTISPFPSLHASSV